MMIEVTYVEYNSIPGLVHPDFLNPFKWSRQMLFYFYSRKLIKLGQPLDKYLICETIGLNKEYAIRLTN